MAGERDSTFRPVPAATWGLAVLYAMAWLGFAFLGRPAVLRMYGETLDGAPLPALTRGFLGLGPGMVLAAGIAGAGILVVLERHAQVAWYRWLSMVLVWGGLGLAAVAVLWPLIRAGGQG